MKRLSIIMLLCLMLSSCNNKSKEVAIPKIQGRYCPTVTEYTCDGCEYIRFSSGESSWGGHKGNCSNPIHKKQE